MARKASLRNDVLFRRFLTSDDAPLRNHSGSLTTRTTPDGTVILEGYGHNLYAERRPNGEVYIYEGTRQWALQQYPENKRGTPITAQHIRALKEEAEEVGVEYVESAKSPRTAGQPNHVGDLSEIGHIGGWS